MGRLYTYELCIRKEHKLITSGPYSVVRHPGYTAIVITAVGNLLCYMGGGSWIGECSGLSLDGMVARVLVSWSAMSGTGMLLVIKARIKKEDDMLKNEFSNDWVEWARKVPYKSIPYVYLCFGDCYWAVYLSDEVTADRTIT